MVCFNPEKYYLFEFLFQKLTNTRSLRHYKIYAFLLSPTIIIHFYFLILGYFYISESLHRDCEVRLRTGELDYETMKNYKLDISLQSHKGLLNENRVKTQVRLLFNFGSEYFLNCRNFFQ